MGKLNIEVFDEWNFKFTVEEEHDRTIINSTKQFLCSYCGHTPLDKGYSYIINSLKKAGYLHEDYKPICCYCKVLTMFGLMDLRHRVGSIYYSKCDDILYIRFSFPVRKPHFDRKSRWEHINVRIHDWSKLKEA